MENNPSTDFLKNFGTRFAVPEPQVNALIQKVVTEGGYEIVSDLMFIKIEEWKALGIKSVYYSKLLHFFAECGLRRNNIIPHGTFSGKSSSTGTTSSNYKLGGGVLQGTALLKSLEWVFGCSVQKAEEDQLIFANQETISGLAAVLRYVARENQAQNWYANESFVENFFQTFFTESSAKPVSTLEPKLFADKNFKKFLIHNKASIADLFFYAHVATTADASQGLKDWAMFIKENFKKADVSKPSATEAKKPENNKQQEKKQDTKQQQKQSGNEAKKPENNKQQEKKPENNKQQEKKPENNKQQEKKEAKPKPEKKPKAQPVAAPIDISRIQLKVGKIVEVKKHTDHLYVEQIDVGEDQPRTVLSGLVEFVPIEEMQGKLLIVVANLKPRPMQGVTSQGMVLCASNSDHTKVEFIDPPANSKIGERVTIEGYEGEPDLPFCNPKKKVFETIQPDLKTNEKKIACWKGIPLKTSAGECAAKTLTNATIK